MERLEQEQVLRSGTGKRFALSLLAAAALMVGTACDDDDKSDPTDQSDAGGDGDGDAGSNGDGDAGSSGDGDAGSNGDAGAGGDGDAGDGGDGDTQPALTQAFAGKRALAASLSDRFSNVTFGADGKIYAVGYVTTEVSASVTDRQIAVARFTAAGELDATFGDEGIATINVRVATDESDNVEGGTGIAVQSDGKVLVAGTVWTGTPQSVTLSGKDGDVTGNVLEHDVVVARLNADGTLDTDYAKNDADGHDGLTIINLGDAVPALNNTGTALAPINDAATDLGVDGEDRAVLFAHGPSQDAGRTDQDRFVVRLTTDGELDTSFADDGIFSMDGTGLNLNDNSRRGLVLVDEGNKILSAGYTGRNGFNEIILIRLNGDGTPDTTFDEDGHTNYNPFAHEMESERGMAEAYSVAKLPSGAYVTTGYGHPKLSDPNSGNRYVINAAFQSSGANAGKPLTTWGVNGLLAVDELSGTEQGRAITALPTGRVLVVGNATEGGAQQSLVQVVTPEGELDTSFDGDGVKVFDFGAGNEQLLGVAVSADGKLAAAVGYTSESNDAATDDATLVIYTIGD